MTTEAECPNPEVHGNPFRYCPSCDWMEPPAAVDAAREDLAAELARVTAERDQARAEIAELREHDDHPCKPFIEIGIGPFGGGHEARCGNCGSCHTLPSPLSLAELDAYLEAHFAEGSDD